MQFGIEESAVVGVPHPDFGETPIAIIVPSRETKPNISKIEEDLKISIARYKHPKKIIVIRELPRNAMGKVQKNILRTQFKSLFME